MVWYPTVDDVIVANIIALDLTKDKHPHKLMRSRSAVQSVIDRVKNEESKGLLYQAAILLRDLVRLHAFAGGNHRTGYVIAKLFLRRNGKDLKVERFEDAYRFLKDIRNKELEEIAAWIERG